MDKKSKLAAGVALASMVAAIPGQAFAAWTRSWVIEWYEPAMYFGGKNPTDFIGPGTDCPDGIKDIDWVKVMMDAGYTREQATWLRDPANPTRSPFFGQAQMAFRGKDRANVYVHPESTPYSNDLKPVAGKIGEGLDLDGDKKNGFVSPDGKVTGIDNAFYRAVGCWKSYRAPPRLSTNAENLMGGMRDGGWAVVIVASGKGNDPMNEKDAELAFYTSKDRMVKDAAGGVARDYSFRIQPDLNGEGIMKARVVKGKIITESTPEVGIRDPDRAGGDLKLLKARAELQMNPDGSLKGYLGGYRPWKQIYDGWVRYIAPSMEALGWVRLPDAWYLWKQYADYSPPEAKGERTHISIAFRVDAIPAFVLTPDAQTEIAIPVSFKSQVPVRPQRAGGAMAGAPRGLQIKAPDGILYEFQDGIMLPKGQPAVSQTVEQMTPPPGYLKPKG